MPVELWTKLIADAPLVALLFVVFWRGGEKIDKLTATIKGLSSKVEMIGRLQDARLDLHEERTGPKHSTLKELANGAVPPSRNGRALHHSWPETVVSDDED